MLPARSLLLLGLTSMFPLTASAAIEDAETGRGGTDHAKAMNHIGAAAFTTPGSVPFPNANGGGGANAPGINTGNVGTAVLGVRWWMAHAGNMDIGLDLGLGLSFGSGNSSTTTVNLATTPSSTTTTTTTLTQGSGILVHAGLPLALATVEHATFLVIPELDIGGSFANPSTNSSEGGFLFDVGARVGPEVSLGFFGLPQLSFMPTLGLFLNVNALNASVTNAQGKASAGQTTFSFASVGMGIAIIYYPGMT